MRDLVDLPRRAGRRGTGRLTRAVGLTLLLLAAAGCSAGPAAGRALSNPARSVSPSPDYAAACAPVGEDSSSPCLRLTLRAVDTARAAEGLPPMELPADFPHLTVPEQLFVAIDRERVDRGLPPFSGLTAALDDDAQSGAARASLPPDPGHGYRSVATEWIGAVDNGLDAVYQWMYQDGPDSGVPGCSGTQTSGCWADRQIVLGRIGAYHLVMGAAFDATGDTSPGDRGGSSLAATLAVGPAPTTRTSTAPYAYTWRQAQAAMARGTLPPLGAVPATESSTGIPDPRRNVAPVPDFTQACAGSGVDVSPSCIGAALAAINHARALEGIRPMVLPVGFAQLSIPDQLFAAIDLERVDRGLAPFGGLTASLNQNAQLGANRADDPPDPGRAYLLDDGEWAGGSSNGLDAVYGWMYDDGYDSGNLDCTRRNAPGCWGHRKGILDDFGSSANLAMGAALALRSDTHQGDVGGTSMAATLAVADEPVASFTYSWSEVLAAMPPGAVP